MNGSTSDIHQPFANPFAFASSDQTAEIASGVASLDSPLVQQTKSEIRGLAAEIAQLSCTALEPAEFYDAFLPRLCTAMGAKGAGIWQIHGDQGLRLVGSHALPLELLQSAGEATQPHQKILQCVVAEGQPILVPPGGVKLDAERPTNPLSDALIVVPVRTQDDVDFLLEVVQRPSGGPTAQRGYLRFVAQMADLLSDYLRRQQLREYADQHQHLQRIEEWLTAIATTAKPAARRQVVADALLDLFAGDRVILLNTQRRSKVLAISGSSLFDPRSEVVLAARTLRQRFGELNSATPSDRRWLVATDRRSSATGGRGTLQAEVDVLCEALGCRLLLCLPLDASARKTAVIGYSSTVPASEQGKFDSKAWMKLAHSVGTLLDAGGATPWWRRLVPGWGSPAAPAAPLSGAQLLLVWVSRVALTCLVGVVAMFPVPQQISATAMLQPVSKQMYYAPSAGVVSDVLADEGDAVIESQPLVRINNHELAMAAESLRIEYRKIAGQMEEKSSLLNRSERLTPLERDQLEYDLRELEATASSVALQLAQTESQLTELTILARADGTISTWDLRNQLLNHPVQAGQLLASTFDPDGAWCLQISVPDYRAGLIADSMAASENGAILVQFSLASHPDHLLQAYAAEMASQVTTLQAGASRDGTRVVQLEAKLTEADQLPLKKDGAIARATINCGNVPLLWLVFRDAYWEVSSRLQMLW